MAAQTLETGEFLGAALCRTGLSGHNRAFNGRLWRYSFWTHQWMREVITHRCPGVQETQVV